MARNKNDTPEPAQEPPAMQTQSSSGNTVEGSLIQNAYHYHLAGAGAVDEPVTPSADSPKVLFKGLRSFDRNDASFFLELLPGSRGPDRLPECVRFWKYQIEEIDPEKSFRIGLLYGPSGCGKSSLLKAGIIPNLSDSVIPVYVEATSDETEIRLLNALRRECPELPPKSSLLSTMQKKKRIPNGKKILIIIDQFEQWLHARSATENSELLGALNECDGEQIQCLLMVRDDFWTPVTRFLKQLGILQQEGRNVQMFDLFDPPHAKKVLAVFGRAFGLLQNELSKDQDTFLDQVVSGLANDGKIVSVRLVVFVEMFRGTPWTQTALEAVGGTGGVVEKFLERTFASSIASPRYRLHEEATKAVLKALLPEIGTNIKGNMRSYSDLLEKSGYDGRPAEFAELICILDNENRLITPTNPDGSENVSSELHPGEKYYQLTHDYLVPSLREWLTRKQRETRKGRAELKLVERAAIWNTKRENKQLPSVGELLSIRVLTDTKRWTAVQRIMMRTAARVQGILWGGLLLTVLMVGTGIQQWGAAVRWKSLRDQSATAVEAMQNNLGASVPFNLLKLQTLPPPLVLPELQTRFSSTTNARHKLSLAFALAGYGQLDAEYLVSRIDDIVEDDTHNFVTAMQADTATALAALNAEALNCTEKKLWRRKARLTIAALCVGDTELALDVCTFGNRPDPEQRTLFIDEFPRWEVDLKAVLDAVKNSDSPALRSGICLAVGQIPVEKISDADKQSWQSVASRWFVEMGDTSTHSAAGWLLRRWALPVPEVPDPHKISSQRDWFIVKTSGTTMLRIRPVPADVAGTPNPIKSLDEFWIGDLEVTRGQFEAFVNDATYATAEKPADWSGIDSNISPTADHPAQQVGWYNAVLYCNWLSRREGRTVYYERTDTKEKGGYDDKEYDAWRIVPGATGYRLLLEAEWEYACRAGTTTEFSSGDDEGQLVAYCQMFPSKLTAVCGEKLPNAWGLHDVHGNVWEWCEDQFDNDSDRVPRGGGWSIAAANCRTASRYTGVPSYRTYNFGFRLALSSLSGVQPEAAKNK